MDRTTTEPRRNITYHAVPYHTVLPQRTVMTLFHAVLERTAPYRAVQYPTVPYHIVLSPILLYSYSIRYCLCRAVPTLSV